MTKIEITYNVFDLKCYSNSEFSIVHLRGREGGGQGAMCENMKYRETYLFYIYTIYRQVHMFTNYHSKIKISILCIYLPRYLIYFIIIRFACLPRHYSVKLSHTKIKKKYYYKKST